VSHDYLICERNTFQYGHVSYILLTIRYRNYVGYVVHAKENKFPNVHFNCGVRKMKLRALPYLLLIKNEYLIRLACVEGPVLIIKAENNKPANRRPLFVRQQVMYLRHV
jgi:hypothetical protein